MNKLFLFLFSFIILSSFCFAIDYPMMNINDCYSNITVNVTATATIDPGEYSIKDCVNVLNDSWQCNCTTPASIILSVLPNAINNYTLTATYTSISYTPETQTASGSSGSSGGFFDICRLYPDRNYCKNNTNITQNNSNNNFYIGNKTTPTTPVLNLTELHTSNVSFWNTTVVGNTTSSNSTLPKEENRSSVFASIANFFRTIWHFLTQPW